MQMFHNGRVNAIDPKRPPAPLDLDSAGVCFGQGGRQFHLNVKEGTKAFVVGLEPRHTYQVEVDDEEVYDAGTDAGGILELEVPKGRDVGLRIK